MGSSMSTPYQVLGLPRGANQEQVKTAFRTLARRFHPDVNAGDETAEQRFKEVNSAYETLANPEARAAYDRALVCRQSESRRRLGSLALTATATFALTAGMISLAAWWGRHNGALQAVQSQTPGAESTSADARAPQGGPYGKGGKTPPQGAAHAAASAPGRGRGSSWSTYQNTRFGFALKYPADVFAFDTTPANDSGRTLVSHDGGATLHIFAAMNIAGTTLAKYRRSLIEKRYGGMVLDHMPQSKFWFVLSGTRGDKVVYEHVAFSCDGKSIHGWQMLYPLGERTFYDLVADEVHRNTRTSQARCALRRG
jgi:curved DNA-binding protein CbpA